MLFYDGSYDCALCINGKSRAELLSLSEIICLPLNPMECGNSQPTSNRYHHLRSPSAAPALGRELGYSNPAMIPTLVRPHRVRHPVCSEPVHCVTTPVTSGPIANPNPDKVLTRDTSTATSRGRMPGNSNGSTSMVGETIHTSPMPVRSPMSSHGEGVSTMAMP